MRHCINHYVNKCLVLVEITKNQNKIISKDQTKSKENESKEKDHESMNEKRMPRRRFEEIRTPRRRFGNNEWTHT